MSKVFRGTPKRVKKTNETVLTPDMAITVTTQQHTTDPFYNGAREIKEAYSAFMVLTTRKLAVTRMILSLRNWIRPVSLNNRNKSDRYGK